MVVANNLAVTMLEVCMQSTTKLASYNNILSSNNLQAYNIMEQAFKKNN